LQYWESINKEKLDSLRWVLLHSGLNVSGLQDDEGRTGLQIAAATGKAKALLVMLDIMRQKREIGDAIDVPSEDDGRTPLMMAAAGGHVKCVDHLLYYGASPAKKSREGLTARDYAVKYGRKDVVEFMDEELAEGTGDKDGAAGEEAVDADGLTSTQRNRLKVT
jgi:cytohesin